MTTRLCTLLVIVAAAALAAIRPAGADVGAGGSSARRTHEPEPPDKPDADRPVVRISGLGWWKDYETLRTLRLLEPEGEALGSFDSAYLEDAVVVLQSVLEREGYCRPSGTVVALLEDGARREFDWGPGEVPTIPRDLVTRDATFVLRPGERYVFERIAFSGLTVMSEDVARSYFVEQGLLFGGSGARRFSPGILRTGMANLREQLVRMGYAEARVAVGSEERDEQTGKVTVTLLVEQGVQHRVGVVEVPDGVPEDLVAELKRLCSAAEGVVYSPLWVEDLVQAVRGRFYARGYARAHVTLSRGDAVDSDGRRVLGFRLEIEPGPIVRVGVVRFDGDEHTRESVLKRATEVRSGDLFERSEVEQDRLRLSGLGAFSSVRVETDPVSDEVWDLTYRLRPSKRVEASVLAGYGSYERVRGGFEVYHANAFGRAHRGRLKLVASTRSRFGDYLYTIPQVFGTRTDASIRAFGLQREEVSFDRRETGLNLGLGRHLDWLGADASVRYLYESIGAENIAENASDEVPDDSRVASLTLDLTRDRLDHPVLPRNGYYLALTLETAAKAIGGEVNYQRLDVRGSWHRPLGSEQTVHLGLRHGVLWALSGSSADDIPIGKRYFPGGERSLRGFREGEASPRGAEGGFVGAEVSTVLNVEFEQGLARNLSGVVFADAGLTATRIDAYPGDEWRVSVGVGLRFKSVIGPVRLEYGRNVVRQEGDRLGTLHFALGFPF